MNKGLEGLVIENILSCFVCTKKHLAIISFAIVFSLTSGIPRPIFGQVTAEERRELKEVFDKFNVEGTFVLFDLKRNKFIRYNPARARRRFLPLSTFKIANSLIALETGVVADESTLIKWRGERYEIESWNKDLRFSEALSLSCVPCYQPIARQIGSPRMKKFLQELKYGNRDISGGIDRFWLDGGLRISADEEVEFLKRFFTGKLPVSKRSVDIVKNMLILDKRPNFTLSGKTGLQLGLSTTGVPKPSIPVSPKLGWFVGYVEQNDNFYFFATNIESPNPQDNFSAARTEITRTILRQLDLL